MSMELVLWIFSAQILSVASALKIRLSYLEKKLYRSQIENSTIQIFVNFNLTG